MPTKLFQYLVAEHPLLLMLPFEFMHRVGFLELRSCTNGDQSQLFAAVVASPQGGPGQENLVPLTWATAAYVGNGLVGVRVQSEEGSVGVLRVLVDNVLLGAGGHRKPTGYFRFLIAVPPTPPTATTQQHPPLYMAGVANPSHSIC